MNKTIIFLVLIASTILSSCGSSSSESHSESKDSVIKTVSVTEFAKLIEEGNGTLLDVRTPGENASGNIEGSMLIDIKGSSFNEDIQKLDKNKPVYVYCRSGARSMSAAKKMEAEGFTKIYNLDGGFNAWSK